MHMLWVSNQHLVQMCVQVLVCMPFSFMLQCKLYFMYINILLAVDPHLCV